MKIIIFLLLIIAICIGGYILYQQQKAIGALQNSPAQRAAEVIEDASESLGEMLSEAGINTEALGAALNDAGERVGEIVEEGANSLRDMTQNLPCILNCD